MNLDWFDVLLFVIIRFLNGKGSKVELGYSFGRQITSAGRIIKTTGGKWLNAFNVSVDIEISFGGPPGREI